MSRVQWPKVVDCVGYQAFIRAMFAGFTIVSVVSLIFGIVAFWKSSGSLGEPSEGILGLRKGIQDRESRRRPSKQPSLAATEVLAHMLFLHLRPFKVSGWPPVTPWPLELRRHPWDTMMVGWLAIVKDDW